MREARGNGNQPAKSDECGSAGSVDLIRKLVQQRRSQMRNLPEGYEVSLSTTTRTGQPALVVSMGNETSGSIFMDRPIACDRTPEEVADSVVELLNDKNAGTCPAEE